MWNYFLLIVIHVGSVPMGAYLILQVSLCLHSLGNGAETALMLHCLLIYAISLHSKSISHYRSNLRSLGSFRLLVGVRFFIIISKWVSFFLGLAWFRCVLEFTAWVVADL